MKFIVERSLSDKVFSSVIKFESYGVVSKTQADEDDQVVSMSMTAEEEKAIFEDFGYPVIEVGGEYSGFVKVVEGKVTILEDSVGESDPEAEKLTFVRNVEKYTLDETFSVRYSSNAKKLEDGDKLNALQQSEAKCLIFEKNVETKVKAAIEELKECRTKFEEEKPANTFSY